MKCPKCGYRAEVHGTGNENYPATFVCYGCDVYGRYFRDNSPEAQAEVSRMRGMSSANAATMRKSDP